MILDNVKNLECYALEDENIKKAFDFIKKTDLGSLEPGKHEIAGQDVFVLIQEYTTQTHMGRFMEAHQKYADIQVVISGKETIYYAVSPDGMQLHQAYDADRDCVLYSSEDFSAQCRMTQGDFAVFYPNELHKPCCELDGVSDVKKAVFKVKMG